MAASDSGTPSAPRDLGSAQQFSTQSQPLPQQHSVNVEAADQVAELLRPLLADPSAALRIGSKVISVAQSSLYHGPIPPPSYLREFEEVVKGSARQIVDMARLEQRHHHRMQLRETGYPYWGLTCGILLALLCIGGFIYLRLRGDSDAVYLLGVPALGVVGWFIKSRITIKPDPG